ELRTGVERVAELAGPLHLPAEHPARVAREGITAGRVDIADDARRAGLQPGVVRTDAQLPGDGREGREVGHQEHVRFCDPRETLDARAVEPLPVLDRLLE